MKNLRNYQEHRPQLEQRVYIDPAATVIGKVQLGADSSVWPRAVLRGDVNRIAIGARSNVQDGCIVHVSRPKPGLPEGHATQIGEDVTIGHGVILHGCTIRNCVLVGNGAIVMDGATIESDVIVAAGALVPPGKTLHSGYLYVGSPCKQARPLSEQERQELVVSADNYVRLKNDYMQAC